MPINSSLEMGHIVSIGPERFLTAARSHRAAKKSLHCVLDVNMGEDGLCNRKNRGPDSLALMRKLTLNLAGLTDGRRVTSIRDKLKNAGWDDGLLPKFVNSAAIFAEDAETKKN